MSIAGQIQQRLLPIKLTAKFVADCITYLQMSKPQILGNIDTMTQYVYNTFLNSMISTCCSSFLPDFSFDTKEEKLDIAVLQINEYTDVSASVDDAFKETKNRMMKLALTDGMKIVYAFEHSHVNGLCLGIKPGAKIVLRNVKVRRGYLCLDNTNCQLLGGEVEELVKLEQMKRAALDKKYRPSYVPLSVKRTEQVPLGQVDPDEDDQ
ncbi:hypothetical protein EIN_498270 [Entamoeba invadens IP1]|uniref:RecQ-mediated genome instability protein 1 n=1 Tax=Entamoeba invadens IP1 TaxID=370355 RepID=A0A0A1UDI2_ENTIV|nr:hypothetical protein EIN_498270 [Entamoeba invadens IP1]ELP94627.1 hypothetical protein EIN_498270 [Entamoeba invadens IP1]|eukprot:XP_004261398.1 hypothetical protein EIN_498270 [Entamoeba invadens IP1]